MAVPTGELAFRASVLGGEGALSGHVFLDPGGRAAYIADGHAVVGRGVGRWIVEPIANVAALELDVYQYAVAAAAIPKEPHRFRGVWSVASKCAPILGDWYTCPEGTGESLLVGGFEASGSVLRLPDPTLTEPHPGPSATRVPVQLKDLLMDRLDSQPFVRSSGPVRLPSEGLVQYHVGSLPEVYYIPNWIPPQQEEELIASSDADMSAWEEMRTRATQEWGSGDRCTCNRGLTQTALPKHHQRLADALHRLGIFDAHLYPMNSVRLNSYRPGQGIHPHCDGPVYYPQVAILSLGSPCVLSFYPCTGTEDCMKWDSQHDVPAGHDGGKPLLSVLLEPRSLLVFGGDAFWRHRHGIAAARSERLAEEVCNLHLAERGPGEVIRRTRRVSLTMRHLLPRCTCQA